MSSRTGDFVCCAVLPRNLVPAAKSIYGFMALGDAWHAIFNSPLVGDDADSYKLGL